MPAAGPLDRSPSGEAAPAGLPARLVALLRAARLPLPQHAWFWIGILALSAGAGLLYDALFQNGIPLVAAIHGLFIGACALMMERGTLLPRLQARLRRLPTFLYSRSPKSPMSA